MKNSPSTVTAPGKKAPARKKKEAVESADGKTPSGKKRFEIDIFRGWCKCCGICAAFCPKECISLDQDGMPSVSDSELCTGCGWCELHCPDFAISVREKNSDKEEHQEV